MGESLIGLEVRNQGFMFIREPVERMRMSDIMTLMIVLAREVSRPISIAWVLGQVGCGRATKVLIPTSETRRLWL